jgi:hypothetical protein
MQIIVNTMLRTSSILMAGSILFLIIVGVGFFMFITDSITDRERPGHFWVELFELCGSAFEGQITANSPGYPFIKSSQKVVAHVRICRRDRIKIALHVQSTNERIWDRSRTLLLTRTEYDQFELRHLNRQPDGRLTGYSMYGGFAAGSGREGSQIFISDRQSEIHDSWQIEIFPGEKMIYGSKKDGQWNFRVDFDLTKPLDELPPEPWGVTGATQPGTQVITLEDGTRITVTCQN